ncbi:MAG: ATP-binding protein [Bacteroidia bacterium]|nr:ATP-binding protein [Bacteroidia bacterium]
MLKDILNEESTPFTFGKIVVGNKFANRTDERNKLTGNFHHKINTMLISPRRWGKSSLIRTVGNDMHTTDKSFCFAHLDLLSIRTEVEFYELFAKEVIKCTSTNLDEWIANARLFFKRITPRISIGLNPGDFSLNFDPSDLKGGYEEILNLPEKISKLKKIKIIVCIDEFQNVSNFNNQVAFQKRLRSFWQTHRLTTYCLYGSKKSMLMQMFEKTQMPFYKFGDVVYLQKIKKEHWQPFVAKAFQKTKKKISKDQIDLIIESMQCHPYYIQQLCSIIWHNSGTSVNDKTLTCSINSIIDQNANLFEREVDTLSNTKVNLLKALASGVNEKLTSMGVLRLFKLGTSANVVKALKALDFDELIVKEGSRYNFIDPVFELWFKRRFLNITFTIELITNR